MGNLPREGLGKGQLRVDIELMPPAVRFQDAQKNLASGGLCFTEEALRSIPYSQLHLCCIGSAGAAACSPSLVAMEKQRRLGRYLALAPDELGRAEKWLGAEGMLNDVVAEVSHRSVPSWDSLKARQKVVAKLLCIYNHVDGPERRVLDAVALIKKCPGDGISPEVCSSLCSKLTSLMKRYLSPAVEPKKRIGDSEFREGIWKAMETILDLLPAEEQALLASERIRDFSCSSDCFREF